MATPTVVEKLIQQTENSVATVTTAVGTQSTDLLVCFHFVDFYAASSMVAPTGTSLGTWTLAATGDAGTNDVHVKVWTKQAQAAAQTIICNQVSDACNWNITYVLRGAFAFTADAANGSQSATNSTSHIAPSISPLSVDDLLLCAAIGGGSGSYTPPSGMTEDFDSACGANSTSSVAELVLSAAGATGTKTFTYTASVHNATVSIAIAGSAPPAGSVPFTSSRATIARDYGETYWLQAARRDTSLVATAADPLVTPLDTAWQAAGGYWHLYNDNTLQSRRAYFTQRPYGVDPSLLDAPVIPAPDRRYSQPAADRRQVPTQRPYTSAPSLLSTALLENELLGGASTAARVLPSTHADRREAPTQRLYGTDSNLLNEALLEGPLLGGADAGKRVNTPVTHSPRVWAPQQPARTTYLITSGLLENELLGGAETSKRANVPASHQPRWWMPQQPSRLTYLITSGLLENELLGGAETSKRVNVPATHAARWWMPQQPPRIEYLIASALLENELLGGGDTNRHGHAAVYTDRRNMPQQRPYLSDPSFYPLIAPVDPLTVAYGTGGHYWLIYNTAAVTVDRRLVPQQRSYQSDPGLLSSALLEGPLLGGADTGRHTSWSSDRRVVPQQRPYMASADLLATALLESPLLGAADTGRHTMWFTDRRESPQQRMTSASTEDLLAVPYLTRQPQPRYPAVWQAPVQQPAKAVIGEDADPLLMLGQQLRALTAATHTDRRRTAHQQTRQSLYFDAGPDVPPLTVAFGAGGSMWHRYNRWTRDLQWMWWQLHPGGGTSTGSAPLPGIIVISGGSANILIASGTANTVTASGLFSTLTAGGTP